MELIHCLFKQVPAIATKACNVLVWLSKLCLLPALHTKIFVTRNTTFRCLKGQ